MGIVMFDGLSYLFVCFRFRFSLLDCWERKEMQNTKGAKTGVNIKYITYQTSS